MEENSKKFNKRRVNAENFSSKIILLPFAWLCVALAFIGAFLPILPTTPFLLLAAFLFSKSSPRLHSWLTSLPYFGNAIIDWEEHKLIRPRAKLLASLSIVVLFSVSIFATNIHDYLKLMLVIIGVSVLTFILTRKSRLQ